MTDEQYEKSEEIARRLGWTLVHHGCGVSPDENVPPQPRYVPQYFDDRNAAQEIVQWFAKQGSYEQQRRFEIQLQGVVVDEYYQEHGKFDFGSEPSLWACLLATPRQIAEAALTVWGIGEGEAK